MNNIGPGDIIVKLEEIALTIRKLEKEAHDTLYINKDKSAYSQKLKEKANLLVELPDIIGRMADNIPTSHQSLLIDQLGGMSFSAEKSLELDSIFYMAALLYPENYQDGDKNDLENLLEQLVNMERKRM